MSVDDINDFVPSFLNPRTIRKADIKTLTQNSTVSRCSLSLRRSTKNSNNNRKSEVYSDKENIKNKQNVIPAEPKNIPLSAVGNYSICLSDIADIARSVDNNDIEIDSFSFNDLHLRILGSNTDSYKDSLAISSVAESIKVPSEVSENTIIYDAQQIISVSFSLTDCDKIDISANKSNLRKISVGHNETNVTVDCEIVEGSELSESTASDNNLNMKEVNSFVENPQKRKVASINLEIKKQKLTEVQSEQSAEETKVLILKTNAIEKLTHVIVQPPNYKLVKRKNHNNSKGVNNKRKSVVRTENNVKTVKGCNLKQVAIDTYFTNAKILKTQYPLAKGVVDTLDNNDRNNNRKVEDVVCDDAQNMNNNSGVLDVKYNGRTSYKSHRSESSKSSPKRDIRSSNSDMPRTISQRSKKDSIGSFSPRPPKDSIQFNLPSKSKPNKTPTAERNNVPHYKIVAGTNFAVDAFSYGEIPNVKHYFLTHFHTDHYSGLKKSFNKLLYCSKITADLCTLRLGVSSKFIHVINVDDTIRIEGVDVTVVEANHCPGAIMLVFTLPNGKTILHTGDFRASPTMESYPVFWDKDVHTVYLDTTYCNPRYDFPTQDESLEMAINMLRQKRISLEKVGKKFSSVLIVCGTYTIGKEKFFLGMARRVGCSVWACPEKDRVLQTVEGHSFNRAPPESCQLHVVPMRDLTHEKLHSYLNSLQGAFTEIVAFKPSGWENGKNSSVEKDSVTIHGIPYSEHSSFSELKRFINFLKPRQVIPTVDISGGIKAIAKHFPCPFVNKDDVQCQSRLTDFFSIQTRKQVAAVT